MKNFKKFNLNREDSLILIVDIQEAFVRVMKKMDKVATKASILVRASQILDLPLLVTEQYPRGLGHTIGQLNIEASQARVFEKTQFSVLNDQVKQALEALNKRHIIIAGIESHVCVLQSVRDLLEAGYIVSLAEDASCSRDKANHKNAIRQMREMGANISNVESILFDLLKTSEAREFREISSLIK